MIAIQDLQHFYGRRRRSVLEIKDFNFDQRGVIGILGANGSGKSTLLSCIAGTLKPSQGRVRYQHKDTWRCYEDIKFSIQLISLELPLFGKQKPEEHIALVRALSRNWDQALEDELRTSLMIPTQDRIETLSRGELTKLKVLLALCQRPRVVLIDEVTNDLDSDTRRLIFKKLDAYSYEQEADVLVATNIVHDMERFANHMVLLDQGRIITSEAIDSLKLRFKKILLKRNDAYQGSSLQHLQHDQLIWDGTTGRLETSRFDPELVRTLEGLGIDCTLDHYPLEEIVAKLGAKLT